ncbi:MAG TPA: hypothetical protein VHM31_00865 [Polyangia bacterium]|nr:hypothetical protein [Polyangia bacterium]
MIADVRVRGRHGSRNGPDPDRTGSDRIPDVRDHDDVSVHEHDSDYVSVYVRVYVHVHVHVHDHVYVHVWTPSEW